MLIKKLVRLGGATQTRLPLFCVQDARLRALERVYEANWGDQRWSPSYSFCSSPSRQTIRRSSQKQQNQQLRG